MHYILRREDREKGLPDAFKDLLKIAVAYALGQM